MMEAMARDAGMTYGWVGDRMAIIGIQSLGGLFEKTGAFILVLSLGCV